jgi:hypothetical protein
MQPQAPAAAADDGRRLEGSPGHWRYTRSCSPPIMTEFSLCCGFLNAILNA